MIRIQINTFVLTFNSSVTWMDLVTWLRYLIPSPKKKKKKRLTLNPSTQILKSSCGLCFSTNLERGTQPNTEEI